MDMQVSKMQQEESVQEDNSSATKRARSRKSKSAFRTISEVATMLDVQQHVLRFWETKFSYVRPLKRGGGRRYYRPEDIQLLQVIHNLLYTEGYTIKGVQKLLKEKGKNTLLAEVYPAISGKNIAGVMVSAEASRKGALPKRAKGGVLSSKQKAELQDVVRELQSLKDMMG